MPLNLDGMDKIDFSVDTKRSDKSMDQYGLYVHVPFCATRCGYCDFNTYTPQEIDPDYSGYYAAVEKELEYARIAWDLPDDFSGLDTVFFGGGTPSLLGGQGLARMMKSIKQHFGLAEGAEVTTESNPESTDPEFFEQLLEAGFTRLSLGMQSSASHVLQVLQRKHTPGRVTEAVKEAQRAGFSHINLDLIYGTPTETEDDLRRSLEVVFSSGVDHLSAYSLIVEPGTAMYRRVKKGELPAPDDDLLADRYEIIDQMAREAGFHWYELSNWARPGGECRHNLLYWTGGQWWGAGPGAHGCVEISSQQSPIYVQSHKGEYGGTRTRLVNKKLPARYQQTLREGALPLVEVEHLTGSDEHVESIMLGLRLAQGVPEEILSPPAVHRLIQDDFLERKGSNIVLTDRGRYLADGIITDLIMDEESNHG